MESNPLLPIEVEFCILDYLELSDIYNYLKVDTNHANIVLEYMGLYSPNEVIEDIPPHVKTYRFNLCYRCIHCKVLTYRLNKFNVCDKCSCVECGMDAFDSATINEYKLCENCSCADCGMKLDNQNLYEVAACADGSKAKFICGNCKFECQRCGFTHNKFHKFRLVNGETVCITCCRRDGENYLTLYYPGTWYGPVMELFWIIDGPDGYYERPIDAPDDYDGYDSYYSFSDEDSCPDPRCRTCRHG